MKTEIKITPEFGRGVYATEDILPGELVELAYTLPLNAVDTVKVNETDLKFYKFKFDETSDCLVLGNGELYNHSDTANVFYWVTVHNKMAFVATKLIKAGEQLFINYNADVGTDVAKNYTKNLGV